MTVEPPQEGPAAIALLGAAGTIERATPRFLERYSAGDDQLVPHLPDVERIAAGQTNGLTITLADDQAELSAVVGRDGRRYVLLTVSPAPDSAGAGGNPLLEEPIDGSPVIVWIKDMDGRYLRVNSAYAEQLHTYPGHVCGRTDAELSPDESIDALRLRESDLVGEEPVELEYTVPPYRGRPAFAVVRFAVRDRDGEPIGTCGVGSPLPSARLARSESERLMKIARWNGPTGLAAHAELLKEWGLEAATTPARPSKEEAAPAEHRAENGRSTHAAAAAERDAVQQLAQTVASEKARSAELAQALSNAEARLADVGSEREDERSKAQVAETRSAQELAAERQLVEELRAELATARDELERAWQTTAERPGHEELEAERTRAGRAEAELDQARAQASDAAAALEAQRSAVDEQRARAEQAEAASEQAHVEAATAVAALDRERATVEGLRAELTAVRDEAEAAREQAREEVAVIANALHAERETVAALRAGLREAEAAREQASAEMVASTAALDREQAASLSLRDELAAVAEELVRARQAAAAPDAPSPDELDRERERAELAEAALAEQCARAEEAIASAEQAAREAAASAMEADAEHRAAEALKAELSAALEELARSHDPGDGAPRSALKDSVAAGPAWDAASQRALSGALTGVSEWRDALAQAVKTLGADGGWDAVIAWCPDQRRGMMKCAAMWTPEGSSMGAFETRIWQHRQHVSAAEFAEAQDSSEPTFLLNLASAEDALLKHAAAEGMGSALLLPIRNGLETVGMLELLSRMVTPPDPDLLVSLDGVSLQLGGIAQLLHFAAAPHWHLDRM